MRLPWARRRDAAHQIQQRAGAAAELAKQARAQHVAAQRQQQQTRADSRNLLREVGKNHFTEMLAGTFRRRE